jgi:hypothetical protein
MVGGLSSTKVLFPHGPRLTFSSGFPSFGSVPITQHSIVPCRGAVAQLGERLNGIQEVEGSIPFGSTKILSP